MTEGYRLRTVSADVEDLVGAVAVNWPAASLRLCKAFAAGTAPTRPWRRSGP